MDHTCHACVTIIRVVMVLETMLLVQEYERLTHIVSEERTTSIKSVVRVICVMTMTIDERRRITTKHSMDDHMYYVSR